MTRLISAMAASLLLFAGVVFADQEAKLDAEAPQFTLMDYQGNEVSLEDYKGKWVVLEWINFGCPFVQKHYNSGNMQELQKRYTEKGVVWLAICSSAAGKQGYYPNDELGGELEQRDFSADAYLIDTSGKVGKMYGAKTTPHMYIINPEGTLVYAGAIDDKASTRLEDIKTANNYVTEMLDAYMAGKEVESKSTTPYGCTVKYK